MNRLGMELAVIIIVSTIFITSIAITFNPTEQTPTAVTFGFRDGDFFLYRANGTYLGDQVTGDYNISTQFTSMGFPSGTSSFLNLSNHDIKENMSNMQLGFCYQNGARPLSIHGTLDTVYGEKVVEYGFAMRSNGYFEMDDFGINPYVAYQMTIYGPGLFLRFSLSQTNNPFVIDNNTMPIVNDRIIYPKVDHGDENVALGNGTKIIGSLPLYNPDGGHLFFNISGGELNVYCFNQSNLESMINGDRFIYTIHSVKDTAIDTSVPKGDYLVTYVQTGTNANVCPMNWRVIWN